jgi:hypothetical protein
MAVLGFNPGTASGGYSPLSRFIKDENKVEVPNCEVTKKSRKEL